MKELIYNQTQIPRDKWRYGLRSSAATAREEALNSTGSVTS